MEDLRREGADVSVPSNSVSLELAEKVRLKYFPKTEVAPKRGIKIIKATKKVDAEPTPEEVVAPVEPSPEEVVEVKAEELPAETPAVAEPESGSNAAAAWPSSIACSVRPRISARYSECQFHSSDERA